MFLKPFGKQHAKEGVRHKQPTESRVSTKLRKLCDNLLDWLRPIWLDPLCPMDGGLQHDVANPAWLLDVVFRPLGQLERPL